MSVRIPVSIGELIDKITILEIKLERIQDEGKRANVEHELTELRKACPAGMDGVQGQRLRLKDVNEEIWVAMNVLSMMDERANAAEPFAAKICEANKRRAAIKREINELTGSEIIEEKEYG